MNHIIFTTKVCFTVDNKKSSQCTECFYPLRMKTANCDKILINTLRPKQNADVMQKNQVEVFHVFSRIKMFELYDFNFTGVCFYESNWQ